MCGVGTRDPCTRIISVLTCVGFFLFVLHVVCCEFWAAQIFHQEVLSWDAAEWRRSRCKVLSVGVSCFEESGSSRLCNASNQTLKKPFVNSSAVFPLIASICPGTYFCAQEHEPCICNGEITYGPILFDGYRYYGHGLSAPVASNGSHHLCGVDQHGQQLPDPAPKAEKFCWCTPAELVTYRPKLVDPSCANALDHESFHRTAVLDAAERGRRYTPWALVMEEQTSTIACAYEFGIPRPSTDLYETAGNSVDAHDQLKVQELVHHWAAEREPTCYVRSDRSAGGSRACSIALAAPKMLEARAAEMAKKATMHLMLCTAFILFLLLLCCWTFSVSAREVSVDQRPLLVESCGCGLHAPRDVGPC